MTNARDPKTDPKPGDIHIGPMLKIRVDTATYGLGGKLLYVECSVTTRDDDDFMGCRRFAPEQFAVFVAGDTEVILAAE